MKFSYVHTFGSVFSNSIKEAREVPPKATSFFLFPQKNGDKCQTISHLSLVFSYKGYYANLILTALSFQQTLFQIRNKMRFAFTIVLFTFLNRVWFWQVKCEKTPTYKICSTVIHFSISILIKTTIFNLFWNKFLGYLIRWVKNE